MFREKAVESQRLDKKAAGVSVQNLLQNLRCTEGSHLTRAAMMCFHPDPESWGRGYYNIELACEETDSKLPKPKAEFGGLTVECHASDQYKELASKWNIGGANPPINLPINLPINSTQKVLLNLLQENNSYTYDELADKMQKTRETIRENLKKLQELGLIRRVGARKNGHWEIVEK